jgi:hypothetical protein
MIDGVLAWIGIPDSDIDEAREEYHSYDTEFIIERPVDPTASIDMLSSRTDGDAPLIHDPEGGSGYDTDRGQRCQVAATEIGWKWLLLGQ